MSKKLFFLSVKSLPNFLVPVFLLAVVSGCGSGPAAVLPPEIDASSAAASAMEIYDTDGNGYVEGEELENAPGLNAAKTTLDLDKDGKVSGNEVEERILAWRSTDVGITTIQCTILMDGRPLSGASITFDPEEFLGEEIQAATAVTGPLGEFFPLIPKENLPTPTTPVGIQIGLYKVRVSKIVNGSEQIPAKYNTETVLGQEVSNDDPAIRRHSVVFKIKSK